MQSIDILKAAVIDNFSGKLLEDGAEILAKPITKTCTLSITSVTFPNVCRVSELKSIFKKCKKLTHPLILKILERVISDQTNAFL